MYVFLLQIVIYRKKVNRKPGKMSFYVGERL